MNCPKCKNKLEVKYKVFSEFYNEQWFESFRDAYRAYEYLTIHSGDNWRIEEHQYCDQCGYFEVKEL